MGKSVKNTAPKWDRIRKLEAQSRSKGASKRDLVREALTLRHTQREVERIFDEM